MKRNFTALFIVILIMIVGWGCTRTTEDKLQQTQEYLQKGQYARAKTVVDGIVNADSTTPEAIYGRALLDEYRGLDWDALFKYVDASPMRDGYLPAMKGFIELAIKLDYLPNARKMTLLYIKRRADKPDGYQYMATIDAMEFRLDSARVQLDEAARYSTDPISILLSKAEIDFHTYDRATILATMGELSKANFKTADHYRRLADLYEYLNLGDSTLVYRRKAVEKENNNVNLRLQLAQSLFNQRRYEEARSVTSEILDKAKEFGPAEILMAYIFWGMDLNSQSELQFFSFVEQNQNSPLTTDKRGDMAAYFGDYREAANQWEATYIHAANLKYADDYLRRVYLKMVNAFLEIRDFGTATQYYQEGESLLPGSLEMQFLKAEMQSQFEQVADSAKMFVDDQIQKKWSDSRWLDFAARYYYRRLEFKKAAEVYRRVMDLPYQPLDCFTRTLDIALKDTSTALADLVAEKLPFRFKNNIQVEELLQEIYAAAGKLEPATLYAGLLYKHSSEYMPYIIRLSDMYTREGKADEALKLFGTYVAAYPGNAGGYYHLARYNFDRGDEDSVEALTTKALAVDSQYAPAMELKGQYFQAQGNMDSALVYYNKAIAFNGPTPFAYYNLAKHLYDEGLDLDRAGGLAMAALRYFNNDLRGYLLLGKIYLAQEKYKAARLQFYRGTVLYPDNAEFHFLLGKTYAKLDEKAKARASLGKALALNLPSPEKEEARKILSGL